MTPLQTLTEDNVRLLEQGLALLEELDVSLYDKAQPSVYLSSAGSHFRHLLEFYDRFLEGLKVGKVDYDLRQRESAIETDPVAAQERLVAVIEDLRRLDREPAGLLVKSDSDGGAAAEPPWTRSTASRELQALLSHTLHHYALIAIGLRLNGVDPGEEFGVAPSTLRYWKEQRACAR